MPAGAYLLLGTPGSSGTPPATPDLTVTNNGDGTGATATITGSAIGSSNVVSTAPWIAPGANLTWTAASPRTGDGTVSLSLANGVYVARCQSTLGGLPAADGDQPVFQTTGGTAYASVHKALAEKAASVIRGLLGSAIVGPASNSVRVRKVPYTDDFGSIDPNTLAIEGTKKYSFPAILVCYYDLETLDPLAGTNVRDEIGYPITVAFYSPNNAAGKVASEDGDDTFLRWREAVERTFAHLRGVTSTAGIKGYMDVTANSNAYTFHDCKVKPGSIFDYARWKAAGGSYDFGWLTLNFVVWRPGGA